MKLERIASRWSVNQLNWRHEHRFLRKFCANILLMMSRLVPSAVNQFGLRGNWETAATRRQKFRFSPKFPQNLNYIQLGSFSLFLRSRQRPLLRRTYNNIITSISIKRQIITSIKSRRITHFHAAFTQPLRFPLSSPWISFSRRKIVNSSSERAGKWYVSRSLVRSLNNENVKTFSSRKNDEISASVIARHIKSGNNNGTEPKQNEDEKFHF